MLLSTNQINESQISPTLQSLHLSQLRNKASITSLEKCNIILQQNNQKIISCFHTGDLTINQKKTNIEQIPKKVIIPTKEELINQITNQKQILRQKLKDLDQSYILLKEEELKESRSLHIYQKKPLVLKGTQEKDKIWKKQMKKILINIQKKKSLFEKKKEQRQKQTARLIQMQKIKGNEQKKQELQNRIQFISARKEKRERENEKSIEVIRQLKDKVKLFEKMSKQFKQKQNIKEKEKQQKLQQIKLNHQSVSIQEIRRREQQLEALHKNRWLEKQKKLEELQKQSRSYQAPYESQFYKEYSESRVTQILPPSFQKMKEYSQHVKENYQPTVDLSKRTKVLEVINLEKEKQQKKQQREKKQIERIKIKGYQSLEYVRSLRKKRPLENVIINTIQKPRYENYLIVKNRGQLNRLQHIMESDGDKYEKLTKMKYQEQRIIQKVEWQEKKLKALNNGGYSVVGEEYLEMMRAKINLLSQDKS